MFGVLGKIPKSQKEHEALLSQAVFILKVKTKQALLFTSSGGFHPP